MNLVLKEVDLLKSYFLGETYFHAIELDPQIPIKEAVIDLVRLHDGDWHYWATNTEEWLKWGNFEELVIKGTYKLYHLQPPTKEE